MEMMITVIVKVAGTKTKENALPLWKENVHYTA